MRGCPSPFGTHYRPAVTRRGWPWRRPADPARAGEPARWGRRAPQTRLQQPSGRWGAKRILAPRMTTPPDTNQNELTTGLEPEGKSPNPRACGGKRRAPRTSGAEAPRSGADAQPSRRGLRGGRRSRTPRRVQKTGSTGAAPGHAAGDDGSAAVAAGGEAEPRAVGRVPGGREKELRPSTRGRRSRPEAGGVRGTRGAREAAGR